MHGSKLVLAALAGLALMGGTACAKKEAVVDHTAELTQRIEKAEFAAMEAKQAAQEAQRTADEAKAQAQAASATISDNTERTNRAFERSQEK